MTKKAPKNKINYLTVDDFEEFVELLLSIRSDFSEDIPPFTTRYEGKLESILAQIEAAYYGKELYPGVLNKAVWLF